jgi:hypothetical protein
METLKTSNEPLVMQNQQPQVSPACVAGGVYQSKVYHNYPWFRLAAWITVFLELIMQLSSVIFTETSSVGFIDPILPLFWCIVFIGLFRFVRDEWKIKSGLCLLIASSALLFIASVGAVVCNIVAPALLVEYQFAISIILTAIALIHWGFLITTGICLVLKKVTKSLGVHFLIYASALIVIPLLQFGVTKLTLHINPTADTFIIGYIAAAANWIVSLFLLRKIHNTME